MSPSPRIDMSEPSGTPWVGLAAQAEEATDAPPVEASRSSPADAEPLDAATDSVVCTAPGQKRPKRAALAIGLALSIVLHAAALAFFLDQLNPSGLEAETEEAVSVEIVAEAPPQPTIAATGSGGAETLPVETEQSAAADETAVVDQQADPETETVPEEVEALPAKGWSPPLPDQAHLQALATPPVIAVEPEVTAPAPDPAILEALAGPPPLATEPAITPPEPDQAWQEALAEPPLFPAPAFVPPAPDPAQIQVLAGPPAVEPEVEIALPPSTEVPVPSPRPRSAEAPNPNQKAARTGPRRQEQRTAKAAEAKPDSATRPPPRKSSKPKDGESRRAASTEGRKQSGKSQRETVSAAGAAGARGGASAGAQAQYARKLNSHIQRHKRYPEAAARQRITGVTKLAVTIDRSGRLASARVAGSSGHGILDSEALAVARRAAPYPPPPEGVGKSTFAFTVSLRFKP